jgi:hypothetical protein
MLRENEPNAVKRMLKFIDDYDKCTSVQRDQVFVPANEEGIISLFVGAVAVFQKHYRKGKSVNPKDVIQSLKLLDLLRERCPHALGNRWSAIRVHIEAFLDESLQPDIKIAAFSLLFHVVDTSVLPNQKASDTEIADLFCRSFHWPNSYRLRCEPLQPCEFLSRNNTLTETWDTFSLLFEKFLKMIMESKSNHEMLWWHYMKDKILNRFQFSLSDKLATYPASFAESLAE